MAGVAILPMIGLKKMVMAKTTGSVGSLIVTLVVLGAVAPTSSAWKFTTGPSKIESARWRASPAPISGVAQNVFLISIDAGYCVGEPPPRVHHIDVSERFQTAKRPFRSAVITAFIKFPAPTEIVGPVKPGEPRPGCGGLGLKLPRFVRLGRPVQDLVLFDGSYAPPRRVWPPVATK